jgi:lipoate---protein ligase
MGALAHPIRVVTGWTVERSSGGAATHHGRDVAEGAGRSVWAFAVERPTLVLGSTQPEADVDDVAAADLGVEVVRRRSGGGAVLLDPGQVVWLDVIVPRGDPLWDDDVVTAAQWLGHAWAHALDDLGVPGGEVHRGGLVPTLLGPVVCFAGTGPGEVVVAGRKVVGISQRRTRAGARFQCSVPIVWDGARHAALLGPGIRRVAPHTDPAEALDALAVSAAGGVAPDALVEALVARLP